MNPRDEFPVTREWVFFNHAAVAPLCRRASDRIVAWTEDMTKNGSVHEARWMAEIESGRAAAARLLGAKTEEIAFLKNTTEGIAAVAEGFPWKSGDNVVVPAGEYPSNVYPWMHLRDRGVSVRTVPCHGPRVRFEDIVATVDSRTRLLAISHVQFATGFRSDLAALGAFCRGRGIDFFVDAIQGLGVLPIDVEGMNIDYLSADGHKWLVAPEGASLFYLRLDKLEKIRPTCVGWKSVVNWHDYSTIDFRLQPTAARFEGGSFNMPGILALGASLKFFEEVGYAKITTRLRSITDYLADRIVGIGGELYSSRVEDEWSGIVSFSLGNEDPVSLVKRCKRHNVVLAQRGGRLRASPHFYNSPEDVDRFIAALAEG